MCQTMKQAVQRRSDLRWVSLVNLTGKAGLWLAYGNSALGIVPTIPGNDKRWLTAPKLPTQTVVYGEHLLSFWEPGILVCARQRVPT